MPDDVEALAEKLTRSNKYTSGTGQQIDALVSGCFGNAPRLVESVIANAQCDEVRRVLRERWGVALACDLERRQTQSFDEAEAVLQSGDRSSWLRVFKAHVEAGMSEREGVLWYVYAIPAIQKRQLVAYHAVKLAEVEDSGRYLRENKCLRGLTPDQQEDLLAIVHGRRTVLEVIQARVNQIKKAKELARRGADVSQGCDSPAAIYAGTDAIVDPWRESDHSHRLTAAEFQGKE